jgi:hypothetical protein
VTTIATNRNIFFTTELPKLFPDQIVFQHQGIDLAIAECIPGILGGRDDWLAPQIEGSIQ